MLELYARTVVLAFVLAWRACPEATVVGPVTQDAIAPGPWGGQHIRLEVSASGATVEYDCAHGSITERLETDRSGRFIANGTHTAERPGPQREDDPPPSRPARFSGRVDGSTMTLTVALTDSNQTVGQFTLTRGSEGMLRKCL